jgi:peptide/nickel transport system permease protein
MNGALGRFLLRRIALALPVLLGITFYTYVIVQFSPNDPRYATLGIFASPEQRAAFAKAYHLNDPVWIRYPHFLADLLHGNLGVSTTGLPVTAVLGKALPVTAQLAAIVIVGSLIISLVIGVASAYFAGSAFDSVVRVVSFGGLSVPVFWLGLLLILIFAVKAGVLPAGGYFTPEHDLGGWLRSMILPAVTLIVPVSGFLSRVVRASVLDELDKDYVRTARGNGVKEFEILARNVLRNAMIPPLTVLGIQAGFLISGAVLVEVVFGLPGLGYSLFQAAQQGDVAVVVGIALVAAFAFVIVNLLVDLITLILDPRTRTA